jgi:hypothetical protein
MRGLLGLALVAALTALNQSQDPVTAPGATAAVASSLVLEVRVFNGAEEVTPQTRLTIHRAGERHESMPPTPSGDARALLKVPAGIYDVQALHLREGRVINIQWANRLVVMPYPDEQGHHLEVINFKNGYGALQVRASGGAPFEAVIYDAGKRQKPAVSVTTGHNYALFVVPAGLYDLQLRSGDKLSWQNGIEVPLERTRLVLIP